MEVEAIIVTIRNRERAMRKGKWVAVSGAFIDEGTVTVADELFL